MNVKHHPIRGYSAHFRGVTGVGNTPAAAMANVWAQVRAAEVRTIAEQFRKNLAEVV